MALVLVIAAVGWPAARLMSRSRTEGLAATPAAAGVAISAAVATSIMTGTSMVPWLALCTVVGWAIYLQRFRRLVDVGGPAVMTIAAALAVAIAPVVLVDIPAVESDARYMWWFHAAWFRGGGSVAREGMSISTGNFLFSRSRYPPLVPGVIAAVWHLRDPYDRELALRVSQLFTAFSIAAAGVHTALVARVSRRGTTILAATVVGVCWAANAGVGLVGFVDLTWAALFASAMVLLLAGEQDDRRFALVGPAFAAAAALVKFEGQVAGVILVALVVVRVAPNWRRAVPVALAVFGSIGAWQAVVTAVGAPPDERGDWSALVHLFDADSEVHQRLMATLGHLAGQLGPLVGVSVAAVLLAVFSGWLAGARLRQAGSLSMLAWCLAYLAVVTLTFATAPEELEPYLDVAAYRAVIVVRIVVLVDVVLTGVAAAKALGVLVADDRSPARIKTTV